MSQVLPAGARQRLLASWHFIFNLEPGWISPQSRLLFLSNRNLVGKNTLYRVVAARPNSPDKSMSSLSEIPCGRIQNLEQFGDVRVLTQYSCPPHSCQ